MVNPPTQKQVARMIGHTMHALLFGTNIEQKSVAAVKHPRSFLERQLISKGNSISMECQWSSIPRYWWILQIHGIIEPYFEKLPALALCSSASVPSPWLLLFLVASSFYEQTICAFQTAMLRPLATSCFSSEMP